MENLLKLTKTCVLFLLSLATITGTYANTDVNLTDEQERSVVFLTNASVKMFDYGQIVQSAVFDKQGMSGLSSYFDDDTQSCLYDAYTKRYKDFQEENVIDYVALNTPQKIQDDMRVLTPEVIDVFHQIMELNMSVEKGNLTPIQEAEADKALEAKLREETDLNSAMLLGEFLNDDYQSLRILVGLDNTEEKTVSYISWGLSQCSIDLNDLKDMDKKVDKQ